jgi:hypothetical protein
MPYSSLPRPPLLLLLVSFSSLSSNAFPLEMDGHSSSHEGEKLVVSKGKGYFHSSLLFQNYKLFESSNHHFLHPGEVFLLLIPRTFYPWRLLSCLFLTMNRKIFNISISCGVSMALAIVILVTVLKHPSSRVSL